MIQKAVAMGNWWWAASSQQCTCSFIRSPAEFFGKTPNHPGDSGPLQNRCGTLWLLAFPQTKITFEREEITDRDEIQENTMGQLMVVRSQGAYSGGNWRVIFLCTICLVSYIVFNKCLYFSFDVAGYLLDRPCILYPIYLGLGGWGRGDVLKPACSCKLISSW